MNRRTLFKGAAASAGLVAASRLRTENTVAQAPAYTAELIYEFTEFAGDTYDFFDDGLFFGVSPDGVITGRDWVDGVLCPVTWDLSGTRTVLDTGEIPLGTTRGVYPGLAGYVIGTVAAEKNTESPGVGVLWTAGVPALVEANPSGSVDAYAVNSSGVVAGSMASAATRWIDGVAEQLPLPEGASWSSILVLAENGDAYGMTGMPEGTSAAMFIWRVDGSVEEIAIPDEISANGLVTINSGRFGGVFGNGDFVMSLNWKDASGSSGGTWIYQSGIPAKVASSDAVSEASVTKALDPGNMIGYINPGGGDGFTGATQWIDGVPYSLDAATTLPAGVPMAGVRGMTPDGILVATTYSLGPTPPPPAGILVLRPTS